MGAFVGRTAERAAIARAVRAVEDRGGREALFIFGEPGSGKSRLLRHARPVLAPLAPLELVGYDLERDIPLAAASGLLRTLTRTPVVGRRLDELVFGRAAGASVDPLRVFEAAWRCLEAAGHRCVVVDDGQWVDQLSFALVHYLLRTSADTGRRFLLVAASRDAERPRAFASSIAEVLGDDAARTIDLGPLEREEAATLLREIAPTLTTTEAEKLWGQSRGSPFWLEALARGAPRSADVPALLTARLRGTGPDARELVALAATATRPFAVHEAATVLGWTDERADAAAVQLIDRGLAVMARDGFRLAHDLIREQVSRRLLDRDRQRLHAALAKRLEEVAGDDLALLSEALAHREAAGLPRVDVALRLARSSRRRLVDAGALATMARIADEAGPDDPAGVELAVAVAQLAGEIGQPELALETWLAVRPRLPSADERAFAALEASRLAFSPLGRVDAGVRLLREARAEPATSPWLGIELAAWHGLLLRHVHHDPAAGRAVAARALDDARDLARASGGALDARARSAYLSALGGAYDAARLDDDDAEQMLALADEALVATAAADARTLGARFNAALALRALGRWQEAVERFRAVVDDADRWTLPAVAAETGYWLADSLRATGAWDEAVAVVHATIALGTRVGDRRAVSDSRWVLQVIELSRGDRRATLEAIEEDLRHEQDPHYRIEAHDTVAIWLARLDPSRHADALRHVTAAEADARAAGCRRCRLESTLRGAEALARLARPDAARARLSAWESEVVKHAPVAVFRRDWAAALVGLHSGDASEAEARLSDVVSQADRMVMLPDAAWATIDAALAAETAGSRPRAVAHLEDARARTTALGARTESGVVAQHLRRLGVRAWRRGRTVGRDDHAVRGRAAEVAELVAAGASNPEIAAALFLSRKTVESHVSALLARFGVRNRTELAMRLTETAAASGERSRSRELPDETRAKRS